MKTNVDQILEDLKGSDIDKPLATTLIAEKSDKLFFITEALVMGTILYLMGKYLDGLMGDKLKELGENHKEKIKEYWVKIKANKHTDAAIKKYKHLIQSILKKLQQFKISEEEIKGAENIIIDILIDRGAVKKQSFNVAKSLTKSIFNEKH